MAPRRRESDGELLRDLCLYVGRVLRTVKTILLTVLLPCSVHSVARALPLAAERRAPALNQ